MHPKQTLDDYLRYLVLRYCSLILAVALVIGVLENLMAMSGWQRSSSGSNFLTMILPAIDTGLVFARRFGHKLEKDEAWLLSGVLTIVATVISFGIVDVLDLLSCGNVVAQI